MSFTCRKVCIFEVSLRLLHHPAQEIERRCLMQLPTRLEMFCICHMWLSSNQGTEYFIVFHLHSHKQQAAPISTQIQNASIIPESSLASLPVSTSQEATAFMTSITTGQGCPPWHDRHLGPDNCGAKMCTVGCLAGLWPQPTRCAVVPAPCDNQKYLQTSPNVPQWGAA